MRSETARDKAESALAAAQAEAAEANARAQVRMPLRRTVAPRHACGEALTPNLSPSSLPALGSLRRSVSARSRARKAARAPLGNGGRSGRERDGRPGERAAPFRPLSLLLRAAPSVKPPTNRRTAEGASARSPRPSPQEKIQALQSDAEECGRLRQEASRLRGAVEASDGPTCCASALASAEAIAPSVPSCALRRLTSPNAVAPCASASRSAAGDAGPAR